MRIAEMMFGFLLAVGLGAAPPVGFVAFAQDVEPAVQENATFDETLFEIPEGETAEFYMKRADAIWRAFAAFVDARGSFERAEAIYSRVQETYDKLAKKIAFASDVNPNAAEPYFRDYTLSVANEGKLDELDRILEMERSRKEVLSSRVDWLCYLINRARLEQALEKSPEEFQGAIKNVEIAVAENDYVAQCFEEYAMIISERDEDEGKAFLERTIQTFQASDSDLRGYLASCALIDQAGEKGLDELKVAIENLEVAAAKNDYLARRVDVCAKIISQYDQDESVAFLARTLRAFQTSESDVRKEVAEELAPQLRFAELVGNEMVFEGVFDDGAEIDWKSYRGKIVLVDFWATWCGPCVAEIPNVLKLYEKYHDAGFDVVGYSLDDDLDALEKFEKERKLPWRTGVRKLSVQANEEDGKNYMDLIEYYGIHAIPTMILVDKDGKVVNTNARGERLRELLEKAFPDVK